MALETLFLSLVLRKSSLDRLDPDAQDIAQALFNWEPDWFREDEHLLATSFMAPADVRAFGTALEERTALTRKRDWTAVDMATGPADPCHWLEFRGGVGKLAGAWLEGTEPGELVRVISMVPVWLKDLPCPGGVMKLFGRDSHHDSEGHREDFGRLIPDWGGKDLWLLEVGEGVDGNGVERRAGFLSVERGNHDFNTLGRKRRPQPISSMGLDHPIFQEGPSVIGVRRLK